MKNIIPTIVILFLTLCSWSQRDYNSSQFNKIDSLLTSALKVNDIPGAALVIVEHDSVVFSKGYGYANLEKELPFDPNTSVVRCGSVSKSFTATAAMILVDRGQLDLNRPISTYLTQEELKRFGIGDMVITTHQLLTHSAGFDERLFGSHVNTIEEWMELEDYFINHPLNFRSEPGQILSYNDQGIALVGYIVEKIGEQPFYNFVHENIFVPLGMNKSSFDPSLSSNIKDNLAKSYGYNEETFTPYAYDYILPYPAAGLVATPKDMTKFIQLHVGAENQILGSQSLDKMHKRQFGNHDKLRGWCYGFAEWFENDERFIFKDGQATGFNSRLLMKPEADWGFYLVWNRSIFDKAGAINRSNNLKREVTTLLIDELFPETNEEEIIPPVPYDSGNSYDFEGTYREMGIGINDWSKLLTLALQRKVEHVHENTYKIMGGEYVRTDDLLFQWAEGHGFYSAFTKDLEGQDIAFAHQGTGSYERVPAFEHLTLQLILLVLFHLGFLFSIGYGLFQYKRKKNSRYLLYAFGALICFIGLPLFALNLLSVDFQVLYKGATPLMTMASWLPFIGSVLLMPAAYKLYPWQNKRLIFLTILNILIVPYLLYWNFPILDF